MQRLCRITVPGFSPKQDFTAARQLLLKDFPTIEDVIATTAPGTVLILANDPVDVAGWQEALRSVSNAEARCSRFRLWPSRHSGRDHAA